MAPLSVDQVDQLLITTAELARDHQRIVAVLEALPDPFGRVRELLNELHRLTTPPT